MTSLFHWIILIIWILWLIAYWIVPVLFRQAHTSTVHVAKSFQDLVTMALLTLSLAIILTSVVVMTLSNTHSPYPVETWLAPIGLLVTTLALIGMFWSRFYMGQLWLPETGLKREHRVIDEGLYSIIRHPIYTFTILFCLGSVMAFPVWWNWVAFLVGVVGYTRKTLEEEAFLIVHLPAYTAYQQRVHYRLIPGVW